MIKWNRFDTNCKNTPGLATCPYALSCPLSLTSDPVLEWSMSESLVTCSGLWSFGHHIEFKMAPNFAQNRRSMLCFLLLFNVVLSTVFNVNK